jgi:hypothetical protein
MIVLTKIVAAALGAVALWIAVFCFEDEEGRIQNVLEEWWVRLSRSKRAALSGELVFVQGIAKLSSTFFDRLFGPRIVSCRAIGVSVYLSLASLVIGWAIYEADWEESLAGPMIVIGLALLCLFLALLPALCSIPAWGRKLWFVFVFASAIFLWGSIVLADDTFDDPTSFDFVGWLRLLGVSSFLALTSLGCDVGFILLTRRALQLVSGTKKTFTVVASLGLTYVIAFSLVAVPWYRLIARPERHLTYYGSGSSWFYMSWQDVATVLTYSNLLDGLVVSVFIVIGAVMLTHRVVWPLLERPVYALGRLGIARRRKFLGASAVLLLSFASGKPLEWLSKLMATLG